MKRSLAKIDTSESLLVLVNEGILWASEVVSFSSEWSSTSWGASQLLGPPDVFPMYADEPREWLDSNLAWAAKEKGQGTEVLEINFPSFVMAKGVVIAETHSPGGIIRIEDPSDDTILWEGESPTANSEQIEMMRVVFDTPRALGSLRLVLDTKIRDYWEEIDAVGLLLAERPTQEEQERTIAELYERRAQSFVSQAPLTPPPPPATPPSAEKGPETLHSLNLRKVVWATGVEGFSSEYTSNDWSASQALGSPDVFPVCADDRLAMAFRDADLGIEMVAVSFPPTKATAIVIAETLSPGGIIKIEDISNEKSPVTLWSGPSAKPRVSCRMLEIPIKPRTIKAIRITVDATLQSGWEEIDAIGLIP
jgi:hypothetical protein